jgi:hypothetical protein
MKSLTYLSFIWLSTIACRPPVTTHDGSNSSAEQKRELTSAPQPASQISNHPPITSTPLGLPTAIPVIDAKDLVLIAEFPIQTLQVPKCPVVIKDQLLNPHQRRYAVEIPANTWVKALVHSPSGVGYFLLGVSNKWGDQIDGMSRSMGIPEASFSNKSGETIMIYFLVDTVHGYPGDGKIDLHLTAGPIPMVNVHP